MRSIVTWFVNNSVPANLFMFFLIVGGFFVSYPSIKAEFFPVPDPKAVTIIVPYPGASASEVEASISSKIEDRLEGVAGIKKINSNSLEGGGYVGIRIFASADFDNTFEEIKTIVDGITTFPENSEEPIVKKLEIVEKVLDVVIHGDVDENTLLSVTKRINDEIKNLSEVSFTEIYGNRNKLFVDINLNDVIKLGLAQSLALFPGVSRSGITLTSALFSGIERKTAARLSFLVGIPAVSISGLVELFSLFRVLSVIDIIPIIIGIISSFFSSIFAIDLFLKFLSKNNTFVFVYYRLAFGVFILTTL